MYLMRFVYDRKGITKTDPKKPALVQIEVFDRTTRKKVYLSTGIKITKNQYSPNGGFSIKAHPNAVILKARAHKMYAQVEAFVASERCLKIEDVKNWNNDALITASIIDFIREDLKKRNAAISTIRHCNSLISRLNSFGKIKTFSDLNYTIIEELDEHFRKYIKSQPVLYKRHTLFKGYIEKAKKKGLIKKNPYDDFELRKGKSEDPIFLYEEELQRLIKYKPKGVIKDRLERVKDMFLFQCFTGMAYVDMASFNKDVIVENNGQKEIHGYRQKTKQRYMCLFLPIAEEIAEKYNYSLPVISNQKYNDYLKLLAQGAKIDKPITSHAGRHTFAVYLVNKGVSMESISKILGHSNIRMTQHYARLLGTTAISEMREKLL